MKTRAIIQFMLVLSLAGVWIQTAGAQGYRFERTVGPSLEYRMSVPRSLTVGRGGCIYAADTHNHRILKFSPEGIYLGQWGSYGTAPGQFQYPWGIAADSQGNVLVVETIGNRVQKFSASGVFLKQWGSSGSGDGQFSSPRGIAVDAALNSYVVDTGNHRVMKFNSNGVFLGWWGLGSSTGWHAPGSGQTPAYGSGNGAFNFPIGIAVDSANNVYVTDSRNRRVQKFSNTGTYITKWGTYGTGNGNFDDPSGIAADGLGNIFVADSGNHRVQKFSNTGTYITKWGSFGTGNTQFSEPDGIAADSSGNIYVSESTNDRIQKFSNSGSFIGIWGGYVSLDERYPAPGAVGVDPSGNILVADAENSRIRKYTPSASLLTEWGSYGTAYGQFKNPQGVTADASGNIYVSDTGNKRIQKFTSGGSIISVWTNAQIHEPTAISVAPDGSIYVVDSFYTATSLGNANWSISFTQQVVKLNPDGSLATNWIVSTGADAYRAPGIAVESNGNVLVTNPTTHQVRRYSPAGSLLQSWGSFGSGNSQFQYPAGIAVNSAGEIFVADRGGQRIQKFNSSGVFLAKWGGSGSGDGQFNGPWSIAAAGDGSVCVADFDRVQKFVPCLAYTPTWQTSLGVSIMSGVSAMGRKAIVGTENGDVVCLDAVSGQISWSFPSRQRGAGSTAAIRCRPAVYGAAGSERIYFSTTDGHLFCISGTGALIWHQVAAVMPDSTPAVSGAVVYVGGSTGVLSFSAATGAPLAASPSLGGMVRSSPSVPGADLVWVGCENGSLACITSNLTTIRSLISTGAYPVSAPPLVDILTGRLLVGTTGRNVICADAVHFGLLWPPSTVVDGAVYTGPWNSEGNIYLGTSVGSLYSFSQSSYVPLWSLGMAGSILSSPVVYNGWIYFGTENGYVYAVSVSVPSTFAVFECPGCAFSTNPAICNYDGASTAVIAGTNGYVYGFLLR